MQETFIEILKKDLWHKIHQELVYISVDSQNKECLPGPICSGCESEPGSEKNWGLLKSGEQGQPPGGYRPEARSFYLAPVLPFPFIKRR